MLGLGTLKFYIFKYKWRKHNRHNDTGVVDIFNMNCVMVGQYTYGGICVLTSNKINKLNIGNLCSIGPNVVFILSADHNLNTISTFPFKVKLLDDDLEGISKGDITVADDVWIGYGSIILSGVHIGQGAVIAAGAVVTRDVPPYAIVGGNPAKVIKYRFSPMIIDYMLTLDYGKLEKYMIREHIDTLYKSINDIPLNKIKEMYSWFPKKG